MPQIDEILRLYSFDAGSLQIQPLGSAGGMSGAQFWRVVAPCGALVLRRWPTEHPTPERLRFIHAVLDHAVQNGITFVPQPLRTRAGESFVSHAGQLWELTPWMPGTAAYETSGGTSEDCQATCGTPALSTNRLG